MRCPGCGIRWTGVNRGHCRACHATFDAGRAFDVHRWGFVCTDPATIVHKDGTPWLVSTVRDGTTYWREAMSPRQAAALERHVARMRGVGSDETVPADLPGVDSAGLNPGPGA